MSFGCPPSINAGFAPIPPDRGAFPLDHYGECKEFMRTYLDCLRKNGSSSTERRHLSRAYLGCRMEHGLMGKDEWKNLGLESTKADREEPEPGAPPTPPTPATKSGSLR